MHLNLFWQFHFTFLSQWLSKKCSSLVLLTSHVKFQVYSRLKLTQRCSSPAGLVSNLNLLKFMSWNNLSHYLLIKGPPLNMCPVPSSGEQGWRSGEIARLPQCGPGSTQSWHWRHMWVEFVAGSLPCSERFFSGYSGFPLSNSHFQIPVQSGMHSRTRLNEFIWTPMCFVGKQAIYNFF